MYGEKWNQFRNNCVTKRKYDLKVASALGVFVILFDGRLIVRIVELFEFRTQFKYMT